MWKVKAFVIYRFKRNVWTWTGMGTWIAQFVRAPDWWSGNPRFESRFRFEFFSWNLNYRLILNYERLFSLNNWFEYNYIYCTKNFKIWVVCPTKLLLTLINITWLSVAVIEQPADLLVRLFKEWKESTGRGKGTMSIANWLESLNCLQ